MPAAPETKHLKLEVTNFGPIAEGTVELRPMTVFVGPSNTGKSYLAVLIYALNQFFGSFSGPVVTSRRPGQTSFHRPTNLRYLTNVALSVSEVDDLYRWVSMERFRTELTSQSASVSPPSELQKVVADLVGKVLDGIGRSREVLEEAIIRCFGTDEASGIVHYPKGGISGSPMRCAVVHMSDYGDTFQYEIEFSSDGTRVEMLKPTAVPVSIMQRLQSRSFFLSPEDTEDLRLFSANLQLAALSGIVLSRSVGPLGLYTHYLPADRATVMHSLQNLVRILILSGSGSSGPNESPMRIFTGVIGDFLDRLISIGSANMPQETDSLIAYRIEKDVLKGTIRIENNPVGFPSFLYRPNDWQRDLPLMNASSMVAELAPVVLYFRHVVQPGDTLIIEEPESHLHPEAQVEFTRLLAAAVKADIRIIITTHSEWVLEELANLVKLSELPPERREGIEGADLALSPDEVGAWLFEPNGKEGGSMVREIPLEEETGTFPSKFGLVSEALYNRWALITNRIERGE